MKSEKQRRASKKQRATASGIARRVPRHGRGALLVQGVPGNRGGHGGGRPIKHGLYADLAKHPELRTLIEEFQANEQPLDTLQEVASIRALAVHSFNRIKGNRRLSLAEIMSAVKILSEVSKAVKRIEDIRGRKTISRHDLFRVMQEMARVVATAVDKYISEPTAREQMKLEVRDRWWEIRLT